MNDGEFFTLTSDSSMKSSLNGTFFSHTTNGSGEKDFKEYLFPLKIRLNNLITKAVDENENSCNNRKKLK